MRADLPSKRLRIRLLQPHNRRLGTTYSGLAVSRASNVLDNSSYLRMCQRKYRAFEDRPASRDTLPSGDRLVRPERAATAHPRRARPLQYKTAREEENPRIDVSDILSMDVVRAMRNKKPLRKTKQSSETDKCAGEAETGKRWSLTPVRMRRQQMGQKDRKPGIMMLEAVGYSQSSKKLQEDSAKASRHVMEEERLQSRTLNRAARKPPLPPQAVPRRSELSSEDQDESDGDYCDEETGAPPLTTIHESEQENCASSQAGSETRTKGGKRIPRQKKKLSCNDIKSVSPVRAGVGNRPRNLPAASKSKPTLPGTPKTAAVAGETKTMGSKQKVVQVVGCRQSCLNPNNLDLQQAVFFESGFTVNPVFAYDNAASAQKALELYSEPHSELLDMTKRIMESFIKVYGSESRYLEETGGDILTKDETQDIFTDYIRSLGLENYINLAFAENTVSPTAITHDNKGRSTIIIGRDTFVY